MFRFLPKGPIIMTTQAITANGALSNSSMGDHDLAPLVEYLTKSGTYLSRSQLETDRDMEKLFSASPELALKLVFYGRMISRKPTKCDNQVTGLGIRNEFHQALVYLHNNHPDLLYPNLHLIPRVGCWKDLMVPPVCNTLDADQIYLLLSEGIKNNDQLVFKFLPTIREGSKARSERDRARSKFALGFCKFLGINTKTYRKMKASGTAHTFQQDMSAGRFQELDFSKIPSRALRNITHKTGKDGQTTIARHNQEDRFTKFLLSGKDINFVGYPFELLKDAKKATSRYQKELVNLQYWSLLEKARASCTLGNVLPVLDTSGSMSWNTFGGATPLDICLSMGILLADLNEGWFHNKVCMFESTSWMETLSGSFCDKVKQIPENAMGSTNFESAVDLMIKLKKDHPEIPASEFPKTVLVISDMQFNPVGNNVQTNAKIAKERLAKAGIEGVTFVWWFVNNEHSEFPVTLKDQGMLTISGFDPSNLKTLLGMGNKEVSQGTETKEEERSETTPLDGLLNLLRQDLLSEIVIAA